MGTNVGEIWTKNLTIFLQENAFKNVVCKISAILSGYYIDSFTLDTLTRDQHGRATLRYNIPSNL